MSAPADVYAARRAGVRARLAGLSCDALVVSDPVNVRYTTGFSGTGALVVVGTDSAGDLLLTDARYTARAAAEAPGIAATIERDALQALLAGPIGQTVGVEDHHLTLARAGAWEAMLGEGARLRPTAGLVADERAVKDDAEVGVIARACAITVESMACLVDSGVLSVGRSEREVAARLERAFVDNGADGVAFPTIVASGPNGAVPHHRPSDRRLEEGDLVTIDAGASVEGYHADCTRTYAVGDPAMVPDELRRVHDIVVDAQRAGVAAAVAGAAAADVDGVCRTMIDSAGFGNAFVHGTGHGVGLEVHEAPTVGPTSRATLRPGAVITVEPGIYLTGVGGVRIEDTLVVTDGPPRVLTESPRALANRVHA